MKQCLFFLSFLNLPVKYIRKAFLQSFRKANVHIYALTWYVPLTTGPQADQGGAATFQGGGRDAERAPAPQHRPLLRFLGVGAPWQEVHRIGY